MSGNLLNDIRMSRGRQGTTPPARVNDELRRASVVFGAQVRDARLARGWTVAEVAERAGLSRDMVYRIEAGQVPPSRATGRVAVALGRRVELQLVDPRQRATRQHLARDLVHSAMGEFEAAHLRRIGFHVGIDEPYQHYQFAGRADVIAWDPDRRALLHIENRTRFPDFQDMAGSFNAKRAYLGAAIGERVGIRAWASETHVIAALWSAEVLHALRLRQDSFRALCPDDAASFQAWWTREHEALRDSTSILIVIDPAASGRRRAFLAFDDALRARPRYRGYADAVTELAPAA
jgi:transcriptional regulator with XRE-family HTH domain